MTNNDDLRVAAGDAFPREEFTALLRRLPSYARLAWALSRDPRLSRIRRAAVLAGAAYVISPIDIVPGIIPVAGQLDDLAVALVAIRLALDGLRPEARAERLASVGLTPDDLGADLRTTRAIAVWLGKSGVRVVERAGSAAVRGGVLAGERLREVGHDLRHRLEGRRQPPWLRRRGEGPDDRR